MSASRISLYLVVGVALIGGLAGVADALVTTDEERVDRFVDALTASDEGERIDSAMRFTDPAREPVEVVAHRAREQFGDGDDPALYDRLRRTLGALDGGDAEVLQTSVQIRGDEAHVGVRVRTGSDELNALFHLRRHGDRWLVRKLRVS